MAKIVSVCISPQKGTQKENVGSGLLIKNFGLEGDGHGGFGHRQVSFLAMESVEKMVKKGFDVKVGDFAENFTTIGIDLVNLPIGTRLQLGEKALLRISQIGKEYNPDSSINQLVGDSILPHEGVFAEVLEGGPVQINDEIKVIPDFRLGIITASDKGARGERKDESGEVIKESLASLADVIDYKIVSDEKEEIKKALMDFADNQKLDLIITTGGTGFAPRDVTPEATLEVVDRLVPGIPEAIRAKTLSITPRAMLSRGTAGIRGKTLIINLPGSPRGVEECLGVVYPVLAHGLEVLKGLGGECARSK